MEIEPKIAAALAGRADQRGFIDDLATGWGELAESFATLAASADDLARGAVAARPPDSAHVAVFSDLGAFLAGQAAWRSMASDVSGRLGDCTALVRALRARVHRDTVNVAVIGVTKAGKSTLLRRISGLSQEHIPSNRFDSTTATPSRIFHEPGARPGRAVLALHTWETFRRDILVPLHQRAELSEPPPLSMTAFRSFSYGDEATDVPTGEVGALRYRRRLRQAQASLSSYEGLLRGGTQDVTLDRLRPFVAYPTEGDPRGDNRLYHAVRSVDIFCDFPEVGAVSLGLVDLPGAGEAGLDVHGRFLDDLRNHADLLLIVKRPEKTGAQVTDQDWDVMQLADDAAGGVRRSDFSHYVINRDADVPSEYVDQAVVSIRAIRERLGIDVRECDIERSSSAQVMQQVLAPILGHLSERLAIMDRDAAEPVLVGLARAGGQVLALADQLTSRIENWQSGLPDDEVRLRKRARDLKNDISVELDRVRDEYDQLFQSGQPITELDQEIEKAGQEIRDWLDHGLGAGSTEMWLERFRAAIAAYGLGGELDRQYNNARQQVLAVFDGIDASLDLAVERLWGKVAAALRTKLTEQIVPVSPVDDYGAALREFAERARQENARTLAEAADRLLALQTDYGSILLRVGRPIVRKIKWDEERSQEGLAAAAATGALGGLAGAASGHAVTAVAGPGAGIAAGAAASKAVSSAVREGMGESKGSPGQWWQAPRHQDSRLTQPATAETYPEALSWHTRLTASVQRVTSELENEFHAEAQRTLSVLAAAVDLFKETAVATPDVDVEYERVCRPAQREIWPNDFSEASRKVVADLAALRQRAEDAKTAASRMASLASQARRL